MPKKLRCPNEIGERYILAYLLMRFLFPKKSRCVIEIGERYGEIEYRDGSFTTMVGSCGNWNSRVTFAYLILLTTVTHNAEYGNRNNNCGNNPRSDNICVVCVLWYIQVTVSIIKTSIPNVLFLSTVNFLT